MLRIRKVLPLAGLLLAAGSSSVAAQTPVGEVAEKIQVTATRVPEDVLDVPASVTVVSGDELEARDVHDLAAALALAGGVGIAPGGDGGPASSVPELMGLREFDAFLLVVDGVPWGGAFNPALSTLDLTNVDRIEILRGSAPVLFGATSFVGVIHVIHRAPDATPRTASGWLGNFDSFGVAATAPLGGDRLRSSISASFDSQGFADDRAGFDRGHVLWSAAAESASGGRWRFAADFTSVDQDPTSPHPRQGKVLSLLVPLDANHNPADAKIDETRIHLVAGYDRKVRLGDWSTTVALTSTDRDTVRGFLREEFDVPAGESNADGYRQEFAGADLYFDSHLAWSPKPALSMVAGLDALAGTGEAKSDNFEYHVALDGSGAPSSEGIRIDERPCFEDDRFFAGAYVQALWKPTPRWLVDAGLRLNRTHEKQDGEVRPGDEGGPDEKEEGAEDERSDTRLSGGVGGSFLAWSTRDAALWIYAGYKNAFKPAAVDFGPEAEGEILDPETAQTFEVGIKGSHLGGRLAWQASLFRMDFDNLVIAATVNGLPALRNAGQQRFEGFELEGRLALTDDLTVQAAYASHAAKFRDFVQEFDGVPTQLRGRRLEMSPDSLASLGLTWAPAHGLNGYVVGSYVGKRYLTKRNTASDDPYATLAAGLGYRVARGEVRIDGDNLTDERPPVAESELGESQYYRLPARSYRASFVWRFDAAN